MAEGLKAPEGSVHALVLRLYDSGDYDRIVHVFIRDEGWQAFFAKSLRKETAKLKSILQALSLVEISYVQGKGLPIITGASHLRSFSGLLESPLRYWSAAYAATLLSRLFLKGQKDEKLYDLFILFFEESSKLVPEVFFLGLEWILLDAAGYALDLEHCSRCGEPMGSCPKQSYLLKTGGLSCASCCSKGEAVRNLSVDLFRLAWQFAQNDPQALHPIRLTKTQFHALAEINRIRFEGIGMGGMDSRKDLLALFNEAYVDKKL